MLRVALFIGRGSRLPALYEHLKGYPNAQIVLVVSHKKESPGIEFAKEKGIEAWFFRLTDWYKEKTGKPSAELSAEEKDRLRRSYYVALAGKLKERNIGLLFMTGWDLILTNEIIKEFPVMNVHPSLTPAFPGTEAWVQALEYGVKVTGSTVHFVTDESLDVGPVILQKAVEVAEDETPETLREKLNVIEDEMGHTAIKLFAEGKLKMEGRRVRVLGEFG
ncbi:phosphoribosylglycinamide formyltransferase [Candidatus Azambacteria bacterium]|nr:phosphoribosylglycinamide formyltransferase [Candidatus Azambacteria bacterium]